MISRIYPLVAVLTFGVGAHAQSEDAPNEELSQTVRQKYQALLKPLPDEMPGSENDTEARIALGKDLYFEKALSANRTQSCNTCHRLDEGLAGVDNDSTSLGAFGERGGRNSPTTLNAGFHLAQFWDGRAEDLQEQAKGPILNPIEMALESEEQAVERLKEAGYEPKFEKAFPETEQPLSYDNMAEAIAAFERTLITRDRFDDFLKGDDTALTETELAGVEKFVTLGCVTCHQGPTLGGSMYQKMGAIHPYENFVDKGRQEVTGNEADAYIFKVPGLRNIALTAPYFHDGSIATLEFAVQKMAWMQLGRKLESSDVTELVAFLRTLSDKERGE